MKAIKPTETFRDRRTPVMKHGEFSAGEHSEFPQFVTGIKGLAKCPVSHQAPSTGGKPAACLMKRPIRMENTYCLTCTEYWRSCV